MKKEDLDSTNPVIPPGEPGSPPDGSAGAPAPVPPVDSGPSAETEQLSGTRRGAQIGDYLIIRELGEGGMGRVYEAEQQHPRRPVALKMVRGGITSDPAMVRLFQREAQTLARLKHPNIAAIYEAGCTADGQHYFTMELVRGDSLRDYVEGRGEYGGREPLGVRERLALFRTICEAISYAHQRGVIHRDLKPANILVQRAAGGRRSGDATAAAEVKILDFGLARLVGDEAGLSAAMTQAGQIRGTLAYMSPEQALGRPDEVDLRADIYALGVILYELLSNRLPVDVSNVSLPEALRRIGEATPAPPSRAIADEALIRGKNRIDRDLDIIVMKALERDPGRRYQSAAALAEDVERYLTDQPILARAPSTFYQLRQLVRRHKLPIGFAAAVLVLLVAFSVSTFFQSRRIAAEAERANREAVAAREVSDFLVGLFEVSSPDKARGNTITAREILDQGAGRIRAELKDQPLTQARLLTTMGKVYLHLDLNKPAEELLSEAARLQEQFGPEDHLALAQSLQYLGVSRLHQGRHKEAVIQLERALGEMKRQFGPDHPESAATLSDLASAYQAMGDYERVIGSLRRVLAIRQREFGELSPTVAQAYNNLGSVYYSQARYGEAKAMFEKALATWEKTVPPDHPDIATALTNLAYSLDALGKPGEAEPIFKKSIDMKRKVLGEEHVETTKSLNGLSLLLLNTGRPAEAEALLRKVLATREKTMGPDHPAVANALNNLAGAIDDQGRFAEAEGLRRRALEIRRQALGEAHPLFAQALSNLAGSLRRQGRVGEAAPLIEQAVGIWEKSLGAGNPETANGYHVLGLVRADQRRFAEAEALLERSRAIFVKTLGPNHPRVVRSLRAEAGIFRAEKREADARRLEAEADRIEKAAARPAQAAP